MLRRKVEKDWEEEALLKRKIKDLKEGRDQVGCNSGGGSAEKGRKLIREKSKDTKALILEVSWLIPGSAGRPASWR